MKERNTTDDYLKETLDPAGSLGISKTLLFITTVVFIKYYILIVWQNITITHNSFNLSLFFILNPEHIKNMQKIIAIFILMFTISNFEDQMLNSTC